MARRRKIMERECTKKDMILAVRRMQDYISAHVQEKITANDLADAAGYSAWHAQRIFRELIGQPPFEYIRRLRLSQAALVLRDKPSKIIDVALDFMFGSHEGFTRSFSKEFGINPGNYRNCPQPVKLFLPYPLPVSQNKEEGKNRMNDNAFKTIFMQVIERPARKILLKRAKTAQDYFAYCEEVGCEVWGVLTSVKEALYEPVGLWLPKSFRPAKTSEYVQGVELPLDWQGIVPEGFELAEFGPAMMMVFQGEPYDDEEFQEVICAMMKKIDTFDPSLYGFIWAPDAAPRFQLEPQGWRGYIEARPVRASGTSKIK
jgi:AraC-like DNA-binding protein